MELLFCIMIMLAAVLAANIIGKFFPMIATPIVQIILGVLLTFLPISHGLEIGHEMFFFLFVAPLAYYGGMTIHKKEMWRMKKSVVNMSVFLVVLSGILVGVLIHSLIPGISLIAAFTLMASLGPTDHIAVDNVERHSHVPGRLMEMLKGESVFAEVTSVVLFQTGLSILASSTFSFGYTILEFVQLCFGGIAVGVVLSGAKILLVRWLCSHGIKTRTIHTLLGVLFPILVFLIAEKLHVSGVVAIFLAGMLSSFEYKSDNPDTVRLTVASKNIWSLLSFSLNGLVFVYLGMQIPEIWGILVGESFGISIGWIIAVILLISLALFTIRFFWGLLTLPKSVCNEPEHPLSRTKAALIFSMSGARGAITMATVSSIPLLLQTGESFPHRELMLILSMGVIICSVLVSYIILPFVAPKPSHEKEGGENDVVANQIFQTVMDTLERQATPENYMETKIVIRNYRERQKELQLKRERKPEEETDSEEKALTLAILQWKQENLQRMIKEEEISEAAADFFLHKMDRTHRKKKSVVRMEIRHFFENLRSTIWKKHSAKKPDEMLLRVMQSNTEYVLERLRQKQEEAPSTLYSETIASHETFLTWLTATVYSGTSGKKRINEEALEEVSRRGLIIERDAIQQMYEEGKLTHSVARTMRNNITMLELQME